MSMVIFPPLVGTVFFPDFEVGKFRPGHSSSLVLSKSFRNLKVVFRKKNANLRFGEVSQSITRKRKQSANTRWAEISTLDAQWPPDEIGLVR